MPKSPEELFAAALELTNPAERAALLDRECTGNPALRTEVESLLAAHNQAGSFFNEHNPTVLADVSAEKPGDRIGRYKLREKVGEGGCGVVYVAEQEEPIRRRVALKVIKLGMDTKQVIARFEAERQALAMMDHPNIAKVLDAGTMENGRPYFVMELVRGIKITDYCDQHHLDTTQRLGLFIQVCNAVQHAHQKGIIHRDLKPSNILVTLHDGVPVPKVIDFGIAKATEGRLTNLTVYTELRQFIGTPAYMSPEQAEMSGLDIDTRSDIYALGVLLYELLTGKTPFDAKELLDAGLDEMRRRIREDEPPRPSTRLSTLTAGDLTTVAKHRQSEPPKLISLVRGDLDWIVMKCLEKDRTRRYETTNGLAMDIKRHLTQEPVQARPPSRMYRMQKFAGRNKVGFAAATAVAVVLVIAAVISSWQAIRAIHAERHAQGEAKRANIAATRAQEAEKVSIEKATVAENERLRADESAEELRRNLYAADMNAISDAWEKGDIGLMRKLLDMHRPKSGEHDLRGFEWFYFSKLGQGEQKELVSIDIDLRDGDALFSPDGSLLVVERTNGLQVHNWRAQQIVAKWPKPSWDWRGCAVTTDNKFVALAGPDGAHLYEIDTLREQTLRTGDCHDVNFSPTGRLAAVFCNSIERPDPAEASVIKLWDYESGTEVRTIPLAPGAEFLDWSRDGKRLYTAQYPRDASDICVVTVLDVRSGISQLLNLPRIEGWVIAVSPDESSVVSEDRRGDLSVIDVLSRQVMASSAGLNPGGMSGKFSSDERWFAKFGPFGQVIIRETARWNIVAKLRGHMDFIGGGLHFLPQSNRLLTWGSDSTIRVWEFGQAIDRTALTNSIRGRYEAYGLQFSPDGHLIALPMDTSMTNSQVALWDTAERKVRVNLHGLAIAFSPDGKQLLLRKDSGGLQIRDIESLKVGSEFTLEPNTHTNTLPKLSADGRLLAFRGPSVGWRGFGLRVYNTFAKVVYSFEGPVLAWAFSPDSRLLALGDGEGINDSIAALRLKELDGPVERRVPHCGAACLAFSPDCRLLAAGTFPPGVNLVSVATGTVIAKLRGHQTMVTAVAFSPDGKTLASGAQDRTIRLFNVETRRQVAVIQVSSEVLSLAFSPDGQTLVSCEAADKTGPGQYRFWYAPRVDAPPLPLPALRAPAPDSIWVTASKLKNTVPSAAANP